MQGTAQPAAYNQQPINDAHRDLSLDTLPSIRACPKFRLTTTSFFFHLSSIDERPCSRIILEHLPSPLDQARSFQLPHASSQIHPHKSLTKNSSPYCFFFPITIESIQNMRNTSLTPFYLIHIHVFRKSSRELGAGHAPKLFLLTGECYQKEKRSVSSIIDDDFTLSFSI